MSNRHRKEKILARDGDDCHYCRQPFGEGLAAWTIDHKLALSKGGTNDLENTCLSCKRCNIWKGSKDYERFKELLPQYLARVEQVPDTKFRKGRPVIPV